MMRVEERLREILDRDIRQDRIAVQHTAPQYRAWMQLAEELDHLRARVAELEGHHGIASD